MKRVELCVFFYYESHKRNVLPLLFMTVHLKSKVSLCEGNKQRPVTTSKDT